VVGIDLITDYIPCFKRQELCPEKRMLFYPKLPKIIGSDYLEVRIRSIHGIQGSASACHVFGHTHFCWDAVVDGIRYCLSLIHSSPTFISSMPFVWSYTRFMCFGFDVMQVCTGTIGIPKRTEEKNEWG
jgi:hypothetical protein